MRRLLPCLVALAIVSAACAVAPAPAPTPRAPTSTNTAAAGYSAIEREIMHLVNIERIKNRRDTLRLNRQLDNAAKLQAAEMAAERKMAHELPGAKYPTLKDRARISGYSYSFIAENIAYGYPTPAITVSAWMSSPGHRANILDREGVETGVGVVRAKTGELYYAQVFGGKLY